MRMLPRVGLALGGFAIGLLLAEGLFRLVGPPVPDDMLTTSLTRVEARLADGSRWSRPDNPPGGTIVYQGPHGTNTVRFDERGLRVGGIEGTGGVLALGDSFTAAFQVEDSQTFTAQLSVDVGVAVHNVGINDIGTQMAVQGLGRHGRDLQVAAAMLVFYLGNDLSNNVNYPSLTDAGRMSQPPLSPSQRVMVTGLARVSHLFSAVWLHLRRAPPGSAAEIQVFLDPATLRSRLPGTRAALAGYGNACRTLDIACLVVLAPPAWVVHEDRLEPTLRYLGLEGSQADPDSVVKAVTMAVPHGIPVVDLTPALRAAAPEQTLYGRYDPHWTAEGHAVVAQALAQPIRELLAR